MKKDHATFLLKTPVTSHCSRSLTKYLTYLTTCCKMVYKSLPSERQQTQPSLCLCNVLYPSDYMALYTSCPLVCVYTTQKSQLRHFCLRDISQIFNSISSILNSLTTFYHVFVKSIITLHFYGFCLISRCSVKVRSVFYLSHHAYYSAQYQEQHEFSFNIC